MELFWKALSVGILCALVGLLLPGSEKALTVLLGLGGCAAVAVVLFSFLDPVVQFVRELEALGNLHSDTLEILLKAVGMGLVTEIAAMTCTDSGSGSLGKVIQMLGSAVMLWLCLPVFRTVLTLVQSILGEL